MNKIDGYLSQGYSEAKPNNIYEWLYQVLRNLDDVRDISFVHNYNTWSFLIEKEKMIWSYWPGFGVQEYKYLYDIKKADTLTGSSKFQEELELLAKKFTKTRTSKANLLLTDPNPHNRILGELIHYLKNKDKTPTNPK